jgi:hypothetical protein
MAVFGLPPLQVLDALLQKVDRHEGLLQAFAQRVILLFHFIVVGHTPTVANLDSRCNFGRPS